MYKSYRDYLLDPIGRWENIPWNYFLYSYVGTFGATLVFPVVYIGLIIVGFIEQLNNKTFKRQHKISSGVHLSILLLIIVSIISIFFAFSFVSFIFGFYIDGYILLGTGLLAFVGASVAMPALIYLLTENGGWGWLKIWEIYEIGGLTNDTYRRLSGVMLLSNTLLLIGTVGLIATGIGVLAIPLLVLWYCSVCADVYTTMNDVFGGYVEDIEEDTEESIVAEEVLENSE
jgi:hypothetical protein